MRKNSASRVVVVSVLDPVVCKSDALDDEAFAIAVGVLADDGADVGEGSDGDVALRGKIQISGEFTQEIVGRALELGIGELRDHRKVDPRGEQIVEGEPEVIEIVLREKAVVHLQHDDEVSGVLDEHFFLFFCGRVRDWPSIPDLMWGIRVGEGNTRFVVGVVKNGKQEKLDDLGSSRVLNVEEKWGGRKDDVHC